MILQCCVYLKHKVSRNLRALTVTSNILNLRSSLTSRFHQRQCFQITGHQHLLQLPVGRVESDEAHVPDHDVLYADVVLPEMWPGGQQRAR